MDPVAPPRLQLLKLASLAIHRIDELVAGDCVKVASGDPSEIFIFTHMLPAVSHKFVSPQSASGSKIALTSGSCVHVNGALIPVGAMSVGDRPRLCSSEGTTITSISCLASADLYNPQTL
jgi:hypothetical protein